MINPLKINCSQKQEIKGNPFYLYFSYMVLTLVALYYLLIPIQDYLANGFIIADSVVYLRVAFNIINGQGSTYDLITITNGYHPLWMILHIPFMIGADNIIDRLPIIRVLWIGTAVASTIIWAYYIRQLTKSYFAQAFMLLLMGIFGCFGWSLYVLYSGIETPLVLFFLGLSLYLTEKFFQENHYDNKQIVILALVIALTFLSRLDSIFVLIPLALIILFKILKSSFLQACLFVLTGLVVTIPYLIWNKVNFGAFTPVSGIVKRFDSISLDRSMHYFESFVLKMQGTGVPLEGLILFVGLIALIFVFTFWRIHQKSSNLFNTFWILILGAFAHYLYYFLYMSELNVSWHLYLQLLVVFIFLTLAMNEIACSRLIKKLSISPFLLLIAFMVTCYFINNIYIDKKTYRIPAVITELEFGKWVKDNIEPQKKLVFYDGFFSALIANEHIFIDSNGLTGDATLAAIAKQNRMSQYSSSYQYKDIATLYNADYVVSWVDGHCELLDSSNYVYISEPIITNKETRLVAQKGLNYNSFGPKIGFKCF
jgi:hypothetical protein